jgi:hypothetical protein
VKDLELQLDNRPGTLARMGQLLGAAGVSVEGGGAWLAGDTTSGRTGVAHFLIEDADVAKATDALSNQEHAGVHLLRIHDVLIQRLRQDVPGQLGALCAELATAGVNIETLYSDHDHRLILVVDDPIAGAAVRDRWMAGFKT